MTSGRPAILLALAAACLVAAPSASAQGPPPCLSEDPPPPTATPIPLGFGITPQVAGSAGVLQEQAAPEDEAATVRALRGLEPPGRRLVLRLNRLFWADGDAGIARFAALVDRYAEAGFRSELQVRYHPPEGREGDIPGWVAFVRAAVRELGRRDAVAGFSITNEANLPISPNTSDGAYEGVVDALVAGVVAAREELVQLGRPSLPVGFNVMWRWEPGSDARFWREVGEKATPAFRSALTYVGLQVYPGLVWPPVPLPGRTAGQELVEALTLVRGCYMPIAGLGRDTQLWVSENGYATNLGRNEGGQASALDSTVRDVAAWSGELGVPEYRYFNLRDNNSDGIDLFSAVGLLRDDYAEKPAYSTMRGLISMFGREAETPSPQSGDVRRLRPRIAARVAPRTDRRGPRRFTASGRIVRPRAARARAACSGVVSIRYRAGRRTISSRRVRVRRDCRFRSRVTFTKPDRFAGRDRLRMLVRFQGNRVLRPASARTRTVRIR